MQTKLSQNWNLDDIFTGGKQSEALAAEMTQIADAISELIVSYKDCDQLKALILMLQELGSRLQECEMFIFCLSYEHRGDAQVRQLQGTADGLRAKHTALMIRLEQVLAQVPQAAWAELLQDEQLGAIKFYLDERRERVHDRMSGEQELLVNDLAADGYHAWSNLYRTLQHQLRVPVVLDGAEQELSAGQVFGMLHHRDRAVRIAVLEALESKMQGEAELFAAVLNHISGFRLALYKQRGWDSVLQEPLSNNRLSQATLDAMYQAVDRNRHRLTSFLKRKGELLGVDRLMMQDSNVPFQEVSTNLTFDEAAALIVEQFHAFSPHMSDFAKKSFEQEWVEAEERPDKPGGGFCIPFIRKGESRLYMSYRGRASDMMVLAHELGHGYHNEVLCGLPHFAQEYPMSLAETASTFAELIVMDAAIEQAPAQEEKAALLADKLGRGLLMVLGVYGAYRFERVFYEERKSGIVPTERITELMADAQRHAYDGVCDRYHPYQWVLQGHFYMTDNPFYNFPYTFGYLFSMGLYAQAKQRGAGEFADSYRSLLRDTGSMTAEELASRHLGVDLTKSDFWQGAIDLLAADVEQFLQLTDTAVEN
ncbi:pepF/M3 family oligoendopeptidase [Tumebacillus sp. BK434]|uniref:M3 family oligoendopeptidase n=1 Tax=Tumebacillus sp. BK434 TaxID=2512169 RepID=UPI0010DD5AE3|nr:M3 family oligoendopeptidase [Tumebacillus sp. BK434]TCP54474.1 pepF/M3 family oligoendopeptidase [Tumebacillus sp. BK434]